MTKKRKRSARAAKAAPGNYDIGRGKPPAHSRWGPGQSGNPGGRKKGQRNYKTMVLEVFEAEIEVTENGRKSKCTVAKALLLTLVQGGLKDRDIRAIARALELYERYADTAEEEDKENEPLSEEDRDIIARAMGVDAAQGRGDDEGDNETDDEDEAEVDEDAQGQADEAEDSRDDHARGEDEDGGP